MLEEEISELKAWVAERRNKTQVYELQPDGTIVMRWEDARDTDSRAYDLEQNPGQQLFLKGYANPVRPHVESVEDGEVSLIPSQRYVQYMSQDVISQAVAGGSLASDKLMWLTAGNILIGVIVLFVVVSMMG